MIKEVQRERNEVRERDLLSQIAIEVEQKKVDDELKEEGVEVVNDYTIAED